MEHAGDASLKLTISEKASSWFVAYPRVIAGFSWLVILGITAFTFLAEYFTIQNIGLNDLIVPESLASNSEDALKTAIAQTDIANGNVFSGKFRHEASVFFSINLIFEWQSSIRTDVIFTRRNLQLFCEFQNLFTGIENYKKFCLTPFANGVNTTCQLSPTDLVSYFYVSEAERSTCPLKNETEFQSLYSTFLLNPSSLFFFDVNFPNSTRTRSTIALGGPLGSDSTVNGGSYDVAIEDADNSEQYQSYRTFFDEFESSVFATYGLKGSLFNSPYNIGRIPLGNNNEVQVRYESQYFRDREFFRTIETDQLLVGGAILLVLLMMYLHLNSLFLALMGMMSIVVSLPVALFVYRALIGIEYFNNLHVIAIFVLLGVGADNMFVFVDAWKQSEEHWTTVRGLSAKEVETANIYQTGNFESEVLIARLSYTYRRATASVFNTASTTAAAFFATSASPIIPIAAFGIYAGITILVAFLWVLILNPPLVVIHEIYFNGNGCGRHVRVMRNRLVPARESKTRDSSMPPVPQKCLTPDEWLIQRVYIPFMNLHCAVPVVCVVLFAVLWGFMAHAALQLPVPSKQEEQFKPTHMLTGFVQDFVDLYLGGASSEFVPVRLVWGIEKQDRTEFNRFLPYGSRGQPVFDDSFKLAPSTSQQYILDSCALLRNYSCVLHGTSRVAQGCTRDEVILPNEVVCFLEHFHSWHDANFPGNLSALELGDVDEAEFNSRLLNFTIASVEHPDPSQNFQESIGFIDGTLKFIVVDYVTTMKRFQPAGIKSPVFAVLDQLVTDLKASAPVGMQNIIQTSFDMSWITLELGIVSGLYTGLAISFPIAFCVLVFASRNVILAAFSILSIAGIVFSVLGSAYYFGWALGIAEATAAVMVIGLSVDYVIHLSHMYVVGGNQGYRQRQERFLFAVKNMGPTVVAGAATTAGSCVVMFLCEITIFSKMASLISLTIGFSVLYSFFFFMAIAKSIGPEGKSGQIDHYLRTCTLLSSPRKERDRAEI